ncbi:MAG TPA: hypothetical protein PLV70_04960, partial [Flavobacteriales bacterium]|nr:hypothetical protein [Flavobacteriales bacterium]
MSYRALLTAWIAASGFLLQAQEITFQATVDRNEIASGEPVKLSIELTNASAGGGMSTPDMGGLVVMQGP